ncbi:MAG: TatD family hydrolase [Kiritimatiellia bacterium]
MNGLLDSHMHLDIVHHVHPERIQWLKEKRCAVISWAFSPHEGGAAELKRYLKFQADTIQSISDSGLLCRFLAGIHPRNIPGDLKPAQCGDFLQPFLKHPLCLGIGEIGLETGDARETDFFIAQLELARALDRGIRTGVHTPRKNKIEVTKQILSMLEDFQELKGRLVVDHCTPDTIGDVLERGWTAGVTLSPVKSSLADLLMIVRTRLDCIGRIMCNTDSGADFHEDLAEAAASETFAPAVRDALFGGSAADFFGWRPAYA